MKLSLGIVTLLVATSAYAQNNPVTGGVSNPATCNLVGTVNGTKIWAGDCQVVESISSPQLSGTSEPVMKEAPPSQTIGTPPK